MGSVLETLEVMPRVELLSWRQSGPFEVFSGRWWRDEVALGLWRDAGRVNLDVEPGKVAAGWSVWELPFGKAFCASLSSQEVSCKK